MKNIFIVRMPYDFVTIAFHTLEEAQDYIKEKANEDNLENFTKVDEGIFKWLYVNDIIKLEKWAYIYECPLKEEL